MSEFCDLRELDVINPVFLVIFDFALVADECMNIIMILNFA